MTEPQVFSLFASERLNFPTKLFSEQLARLADLLRENSMDPAAAAYVAFRTDRLSTLLAASVTMHYKQVHEGLSDDEIATKVADAVRAAGYHEQMKVDQSAIDTLHSLMVQPLTDEEIAALTPEERVAYEESIEAFSEEMRLRR